MLLHFLKRQRDKIESSWGKLLQWSGLTRKLHDGSLPISKGSVKSWGLLPKKYRAMLDISEDDRPHGIVVPLEFFGQKLLFQSLFHSDAITAEHTLPMEIYLESEGSI